MAWSRWIVHDGDGSVRERLIGRLVWGVNVAGDEAQEVVGPPAPGAACCFDWSVCKPHRRIIRFRIWNPDAAKDLLRIVAEPVMEEA